MTSYLPAEINLWPSMYAFICTIILALACYKWKLSIDALQKEVRAHLEEEKKLEKWRERTDTQLHLIGVGVKIIITSSKSLDDEMAKQLMADALETLNPGYKKSLVLKEFFELLTKRP